MSKKNKGIPFIIVGGAVVLLFALSFVPWSKITGNRLKDFNLLGDLFKTESRVTASETIDPELELAMADVDGDDAKGPADAAGVSQFADLTSPAAFTPKDPVDNIDADGTVIIEDYSMSGNGPVNLRRALGNVNSRPVRIAFIGDSYIEGDILTMNIRESLQSRYGGSGVGYMPVSSDLTGFRSTVRQECSGWKKHEIRKNAEDSKKTLPGEYFTSDGSGKATFKGVSKPEHLDSWDVTTGLVIAPQGGSVTLSSDTDSRTVELKPSDDVVAVTLESHTASAKLSATAGVEVLGVYLNDGNGVYVDNMSLRGNSGITHRKLSVERAAQMRPFADYDLIVVEYGINALSSQQSDYSGYRKLMVQTVNRLRECYPNADILLMGIGDRGQKIDGEVKSVPTSQNMVNAQRDAARETGILFWDTRAAMGGEDAVVVWREKGLINPDYIHLNQKGGKALADLFVNALNKSL